MFVISAGAFVTSGALMMYPVLLPQLRATYGFDLATGGFLLTVLWVTFGAGQLPSGVLSDRFGEGTILIGSLLLFGVALLAVVTAGITVVLFAATALVGFGNALFSIGRYSALADLYPERLGTATGVTLAASDAGQAVLPPLAGGIAAALTWQLGFGLAIPICLGVAGAVWLTIPLRTSDAGSAVDTLSLDTVRYVVDELTRQSIGYGTAIFVLFAIIWQVFTGFYPTYLVDVKGLSPTIASLFFGLFFALGVVFKPLSGMSYDRFGVRWSIVSITGLPGLALIALPFLTNVWHLLGVTVLVSPILGSGTVSMSLLLEELAGDVQGTGFGILRTIALFVAAPSPFVFGVFAERGFFDEGFFLLAGVAGLMILLVSIVPEP